MFLSRLFLQVVKIARARVVGKQMGMVVHFCSTFLPHSEMLLFSPGSPNSPSVNVVLKVKLVLSRQVHWMGQRVGHDWPLHLNILLVLACQCAGYSDIPLSWHYLFAQFPLEIQPFYQEASEASYSATYPSVVQESQPGLEVFLETSRDFQEL